MRASHLNILMLPQFVFTIIFLMVLKVADAQNISKLEYFFDEDPGYGNGQEVSITADTLITDLTFNVDISSLSDGFHKLSIRFQDENGVWGHTTQSTIYKIAAGTLTSNSNVSKLEYFFDEDPGYGNGQEVSISADTLITDLTFNVDISSLSDGFHKLSIRFQDENGVWGHTTQSTIYKIAAGTLTSNSNVSKLEYFFDEDPGYGNGQEVSISADTLITDLIFNVDISSLSDGLHKLSIRFQDENGVWGHTIQSTIYKIATSNLPTTSNLVKMEYFFDEDPGYGSGKGLSFTADTLISDLTFDVDISSLSDGFHKLSIRFQDENGVWGHTTQSTIYKIPASTTSTLSNVSYMEYYIDSDPGRENGIEISFSPGTSVEEVAFEIDVTAVDEGDHYLYVRAKDDNGQWSIVQNSYFRVCNTDVPELHAATDITTSSFVASWEVVPGATAYRLDVSSDTFNTFVSGYQDAEYFVNSAEISGLNEGTTYQFRVRAVDGCPSLNSDTLEVDVPLSSPSSQPSNLQFNNPTENGFQVTFSAASGSPSGYLIIRRINEPPEFTPVDNTAYTQGQNVGNSEVAFIGNTLGFVETTLEANMDYFYSCYAFNNSGSLYAYNTENPLTGNFYTVAAEPANSPTAFTLNEVLDVSISASFSHSSGGADGYLILRSENETTSGLPSDGVNYNASETIGDATVVQVSDSTGFLDQGLSETTSYHYFIYAYNGLDNHINYNTTTPLEGTATTLLNIPDEQPVNFQVSALTETSFDIGFEEAVGTVSGYLAVRQAESFPESVPVHNTVYSEGQLIGDAEIAYVGSGTMFSETGFNSNTTFYYRIYAYNENDTLVSYNLSDPLMGIASTLVYEPAGQAAGIWFENISSTSVDVSWNFSGTSPDGYIVLREQGSVSSTLPNDGTSYAVGDSVGNAIVGYIGTDTTFSDLTLNGGTNYTYTVYAYNGTATAVNYNTELSGTNQADMLTIPHPPTNLLVTNVAETGFQLDWDASTGTDHYLLDISTDNFNSFVDRYTDSVLVSNTISITGLEGGTIYQVRLSASNASGISGESFTAEQITLPAIPQIDSTNNVSQGSFNIYWENVNGASDFHLDVATNIQFSNLLSGYNDLTSTTNSAVVTGLDAGENYFARVRASNAAGVTASSATFTQILVPATPELQDPSNVTGTSFLAKWIDANGADSYRLDVSLATDNFDPPLEGYTDLEVVGATELLVTGLSPNTPYSYRVRAINTAGVSPNSSVKDVNTQTVGNGEVLQFSTLNYSEEVTNSITVQVELLEGVEPVVMRFLHRGIREEDYDTLVLAASSNGIYAVEVTSSMVDELGVEFLFRATDANGDSRNSGVGHSYVSIPVDGLSIPNLLSGGTLDSYTIFSIPYELEDNLISSIFDELGKYDIKKWRLMRHQFGRNVDFGDGISKIELGKSYWFNSKKTVSISFIDGTVVPVSQNEPFIMRLEPGWNQIGNPFPYNMSWSAILSHNNNPPVGEIKIYNAPEVKFVNTDLLESWKGAFVHNDLSSAQELEIPVNLNNSSGRIETQRIYGNDIDQTTWFLKLGIKQKNITYQLSGIGMHPDARNSKDWYDDIQPPKWGANPALYVWHQEYFNPRFSRDIVPPSDIYTWELTIEAEDKSILSLNWDGESIKHSRAKLFLIDYHTGFVVDMATTNSYTIDPELTRSFEIIFTRDELLLETPLPGPPYPNPGGSLFYIPVYLAEPQTVTIDIIDKHGTRADSKKFSAAQPGFYVFEWELPEYLSNGIYHLRYHVGSKIYHKTIILKR